MMTLCFSREQIDALEAARGLSALTEDFPFAAGYESEGAAAAGIHHRHEPVSDVHGRHLRRAGTTV